MSYRIEYGAAVPLKFQKQERKRYVRLLTALFVLLFALGVGKYYPQGRQVLQNLLLPGEPSVTEQAISGMIADLAEGVTLGDAMAAFCRQIIDDGTAELH